uniref:Putative ovule protein n=1 Tax=Solanum chacoense TaxID=4108 RepID=A0A0V0HVA4_SOLCH
MPRLIHLVQRKTYWRAINNCGNIKHHPINSPVSKTHFPNSIENGGSVYMVVILLDIKLKEDSLLDF